jgi:hypothetical protein
MPPRSQTCLTFLGISVQSSALGPFPGFRYRNPTTLSVDVVTPLDHLVSYWSRLFLPLPPFCPRVSTPFLAPFRFTLSAFESLLSASDTGVGALVLYLTLKNFISSFDRRLFFVSFFLSASHSAPLLVQSYLSSTALGYARLIPGHSNVSPDQSLLGLNHQ